MEQNVFQLGIRDADCRYSEFAMNYNAYLVCGEKNCLIHTVPKADAAVLLEQLEEAAETLDYLLFLQTEPCYTGALEDVLRRYPDVCVIAAPAGLRNLKEQTEMPFREMVAKDHAVLDLGKGVVLQFALTPNLGWPDSMLCFYDREETVFSADYQSSYCGMADFAERFYRDRLEPFAEYLPIAERAIAEHESKWIRPGHGFTSPTRPYQKKHSEERVRICICYASVYGATEEMARYLAEILRTRGVSYSCVSCTEEDSEEIQKKLEQAEGWLFGVPTRHRKIAPEMMCVLTEINAVKAGRKPFGVFGSYGWSGEGCAMAEHYLQGLRARLCRRAVRSIFRPDAAVKKELESMADAVCAMLSE